MERKRENEMYGEEESNVRNREGCPHSVRKTELWLKLFMVFEL